MHERGHFLADKFDQQYLSKPYCVIIKVFTELCDLILAEDESALIHKRTVIREAVGNEGRVLTDVLPNLHLIIGEQPAVSSLGIMESRHRFHDVLCKFVTALSTPESPMVIFFDDLQWSDESSLDLINVLMTSPESRHILYVGSYRDNEVTLSCPITNHLQVIRGKGANMIELKIGNIGIHSVRDLVSDVLGIHPNQTTQLAHLVHRKTGGNPFFVIHFLKRLYNDGLVKFCHKRFCWQWDIAQIESKRNVTDNVVKLITNEIGRLPEPVQNILQVASCIGNTFELTFLKQIMDTNGNIIEEEREGGNQLCNTTHQTLEKANNKDGSLFESHSIEQCVAHAEIAGMITHLRTYGSQEKDKLHKHEYRFAHDQIQQAVHILLPEQEQKLLHLKIGRYLQKQASMNGTEDRLYGIVNQLNCGLQLVTSKTERIEIARLNLQAGKKAKSFAAHTSAYGYFKTGIDLLKSVQWNDQYKLNLQLHTLAAETSYLISNFEEMEQHSQHVLTNASCLLDRISVYSILISGEPCSLFWKHLCLKL